MSFVTITGVVLLTAVFLHAPILVSAFSYRPGTFSYRSCSWCCFRGTHCYIRNNTYIVWANNDTGHFNVFFAKSTDCGKTLKTMMISAPNKGNTVNENTEISSFGNQVYVTWWTNKTGVLMPVFRASNDNGDTFGRTVTLNSTGVPIAVPKIK